MPCFARVSRGMVVSGGMLKCSDITDCGKLEQLPASCYYLLVVKLVVKGKGLLLRVIHIILNYRYTTINNFRNML